MSGLRIKPLSSVLKTPVCGFDELIGVGMGWKWEKLLSCCRRYGFPPLVSPCVPPPVNKYCQSAGAERRRGAKHGAERGCWSGVRRGDCDAHIKRKQEAWITYNDAFPLYSRVSVKTENFGGWNLNPCDNLHVNSSIGFNCKYLAFLIMWI